MQIVKNTTILYEPQYYMSLDYAFGINAKKRALRNVKLSLNL